MVQKEIKKEQTEIKKELNNFKNELFDYLKDDVNKILYYLF